MGEAILKYLIVPLIAVLGVYVVGSLIYQLFGIPAIVLLGAVGGITFFARFFRN